MLLGCLRYLLTFLVLTAVAPRATTTTYADGLAIDQAPAQSVTVGDRTPDPSDIGPGILVAKPIVSPSRWPEVIPEPVIETAPRCARRVISRIHWCRRRVPRLRDDASDH